MPENKDNEEVIDEEFIENVETSQEEEGDAENADITKELNEQKDKYLRLMAEYDNFRKRSAKERSETYADAASKTLSEILPILDNFERAIEAECSDESFKSGMTMIFKQFSDVLTRLGVEVLNPIGEEFDPNIANAINQIEDESYGENIVAQVFQKGYRISGKVIRYAMVVVANP